jgi:hypothetical protein
LLEFVKRRVPELASGVRESLKTAPINDRVAGEVAKLIEQRSSEVIDSFAR